MQLQGPMVEMANGVVAEEPHLPMGSVNIQNVLQSKEKLVYFHFASRVDYMIHVLNPTHHTFSVRV